MSTVDFSPFYRSSIGFDRLFNMLDSTTQDATTQSYPPYNIERTGENAYRISIAVAGFGENELDVEVRDQTLSVRGKKEETKENAAFLHRGIATRNFERRFELADHVSVSAAGLDNGLLNIDLERVIPEALKPRKIDIAGSKAKVLEGQAA